MAKTTGISPNYSEQYTEQCFFIWYNKNRGRGKFAINDGFPPSDDGNVPAITTVETWRRKFGWDERAEVMDAEVSRALEKEAIQKKVETLKKVTEWVDEASQKAKQYLLEQGFDSSSSAARMLLGGSEFLAKFAGAGEMLAVVKNMNDTQLTKELNKLLGKNENVDLEVIAEEIIDGYSTTTDDQG